MDTDTRHLVEAYQQVYAGQETVVPVEPVNSLLTGINNKEEIPDKIKSLVYNRLKIGTGINFTIDERQSSGIFIEKWPGYEEWEMKAGGWGNLEQPTIELETEEFLEGWLDDNLTEYRFTHYQQYQLLNKEGNPIKTARSADPYDDDQDVGDYERYGPDPIRPEY